MSACKIEFSSSRGFPGSINVHHALLVPSAVSQLQPLPQFPSCFALLPRLPLPHQPDAISTATFGRISSLPKGCVSFFPRSSGPETQPDPGGPRSSFEKQDGEYDAERETERGADDKGGDSLVPLEAQISAIDPNRISAVQLLDGWRKLQA